MDTFSNNLETPERTDIGLSLFRSDCCPDLNVGVTFATFHLSGKTPLQSDSLNIIARGTQISSDASFNTFAGILSGPGDFDSFSPFSAVSTHCFETDLNLNLADFSMAVRY